MGLLEKNNLTKIIFNNFLLYKNLCYECLNLMGFFDKKIQWVISVWIYMSISAYTIIKCLNAYLHNKHLKDIVSF